MAALNDIRAHIKSVEQTRKITNAMYLISSSRMRKAMKNIEQNRAYFYRAFTTMREIRAHTGFAHPYITHREGEGSDKTAYIVIAGERGLSGSYNSSILKVAEDSMEIHKPTHIFTVGEKAAAHFKSRGRAVNENFVHIGQAPSIETARRLTNIVMGLYDTQEIDEVRLVYTRFKNSFTQITTDMELLPIELGGMGIEIGDKINDTENVLYEPSAEEVFNELVPQFIIGYIYGALVHAYASENVARMSAMETATSSADELLEKLTHEYHTARQVSITNELAEIVGAAAILGENHDNGKAGLL